MNTTGKGNTQLLPMLLNLLIVALHNIKVVPGLVEVCLITLSCQPLILICKPVMGAVQIAILRTQLHHLSLELCDNALK